MSAATSQPLDVQAIRADFPTLDQQVHGKPLVYLDSGATALKPRAVLDAVRRHDAEVGANVHRGVHALSQRATAAYEAARQRVKAFFGVPESPAPGGADDFEAVFVRGTTEAINLVARSWGQAGGNLGPGDQVLVTGMEHHSNIVPWQLVCEATGAELVHVPIEDDGSLSLDAFRARLSDRTKLVGVVHVSNALGTVNPVAEMAALAHDAGALVLVDGAQSAPHVPVDLPTLGADFFAFSGHKVYGPTGIGALLARRSVLKGMPPWQGGGDMICMVTFEGSTYAKPPARFEAGTPAIAQAVGLAAALDYVEGLGREAVAAHEAELLAYGAEVLTAIPGVRLVGTAPRRAGVLSFVMEGVHPHDVGTIVDMEGVAIRVGHHCAQPVMKRFGVPATARASLGVYNTRADLDALGRALTRVKEFFG